MGADVVRPAMPDHLGHPVERVERNRLGGITGELDHPTDPAHASHYTDASAFFTPSGFRAGDGSGGSLQPYRPLYLARDDVDEWTEAEWCGRVRVDATSDRVGERLGLHHEPHAVAFGEHLGDLDLMVVDGLAEAREARHDDRSSALAERDHAAVGTVTVVFGPTAPLLSTPATAYW